MSIKKYDLSIAITWLTIVCSSFLVGDDANGQTLSPEVREKFETMIGDLDSSVKTKFQSALDNNSAVVELTPSEFKKFRNNSANPFDIDDIDPADLDGNIELRFELPSLRNRPVNPLERQTRSLRRRLRSKARTAASSTVAFYDGEVPIALGIVIRQDGLIATKASEIADRESLACRLGSGATFMPEILQTDFENDVALVQIVAPNLIPAALSDRQPVGGSFVLTPNQVGEVVSIGSYSVVSRSLVGENQAILGVAPQTVDEGVEIVERVEAKSAAYQAGLKQGDIITRIDDQPIAEVVQLVEQIRKRKAGDRIRIEFLREGFKRSTVAKLAGRTLSADRAARFKMMSQLGAILSERKSEFPVVFQHDSPLFPEQCGGPICDLSGNVIGMNIARESRAASLAIPSNHLKQVVRNLLRYDVASRNSSNH